MKKLYLKCEVNDTTAIFDHLNGYNDFLEWLVGNAKNQKNIETEKVLHYKYDTGDYTNHNKLIPMQFSVSTIAPERFIFAEKRC